MTAAGRQFSWIRRTRQGGDAWGAGSVPLNEAFEAYDVRLYSAAGVIVHNETVATPGYLLGPGLEASLFPSGIAGASIGIAQISETCGPGAAARLWL